MTSSNFLRECTDVELDFFTSVKYNLREKNGVFIFDTRRLCLKKFYYLSRSKFDYNDYLQTLDDEKKSEVYLKEDNSIIDRLWESGKRFRNVMGDLLREDKSNIKYSSINTNPRNQPIGKYIDNELKFRENIDEIIELSSIANSNDWESNLINFIKSKDNELEFRARICDTLSKLGFDKELSERLDDSNGLTVGSIIGYINFNYKLVAACLRKVLLSIVGVKWNSESYINNKFIFESLASFIKPEESFTTGVPRIYYDRIINGVENELKSHPEDRFGLGESHRNRKSNKESLIQKCMFFTSWLYSLLKKKERPSGYILCADFSGDYLSTIFGDCSRNGVKIGWQSIKNFLIENKVLRVADSSVYHGLGLESMCRAYSLSGIDLDSDFKPMIITKNGRRFVNNNKFTIDDLEIIPYEINDKKLLKAAAKRKVRYINPMTVVGMQTLCLSKLTLSDEAYKQITEVELPNMIKKGEFDDNLYKVSTTKFIEAIYHKDYFSLRVSQSKLTNRIFTGMTCISHLLRPYFKLEGYDGNLIQFDAKSSQLMLAALDYANSFGDESALNFLIEHDIYNDAVKLANNGILDKEKHNFTRGTMKKEAFHFLFVNKYGSDNLIFGKGLKLLLPKFYNYIMVNKGNWSLNRLARKLQRIESSLFVGRYHSEWKHDTSILSNLYRLGIWAISIHDSIIVRECDKDQVYRVIKKVYRNKFDNLSLSDSQLDNIIKCTGLDK